MAFGGLLEGFLEEKSFGSERKQRPRPHSLVQRRFSTAGEANVERGALKKMSVVSVDASSPRNSWQQPFCSPMVPHVPIRERLARRGTSADVSDDVASGYNCYAPRRRRMSLLQSLRYQNKALADSGCDIHRVRTDSESTNRDTCSPPQKTSPPVTPNNKKTFSQLKTKIFGKKEKGTPVYNNGEYSQSCDVINNGRPSSRKSPSTTNDSGRGSQGHLEERLETMAIIEREDEPDDLEEDVVEMMKPLRPRTNSCPDLSTLRFLSPKKKASASTSSASRRAPIVDSESDEDRTISPVTAADCLHERRLQRKFEEQRRQQQLAM